MMSVSKKALIRKVTRPYRNRAFTLIELITVLSIMGVVLALVGPLTINFIDKTQAQTEYISLQNKIKKLSYLSFASATSHRLKFDGSTVELFKADLLVKKSTFDYIQFKRQEVTLSSRGYPSPETLEVIVKSSTKSINLFKLVEGTKNDKR